jgi:hypothetical protein
MALQAYFGHRNIQQPCGAVADAGAFLAQQTLLAV